IALLSSVVLASLQTARAKGRDAKRISDLKQMQVAVEMYYNDHGSYPRNYDGTTLLSATTWRGTTVGCYGSTASTKVMSGVAPKYIPQLPQDPKPIGSTLCYLYRSDGKDY